MRSHEESGRAFLVIRRDASGTVTEFSRVDLGGVGVAIQETTAGERVWITELLRSVGVVGVDGQGPEGAAAGR